MEENDQLGACIYLDMTAASRESDSQGRRRTTSRLAERFTEVTLQIVLKTKWLSLAILYTFLYARVSQ